jgi:hypothetical protein
MCSSEATAFVNSEWTFAVFQPFKKLRQKSRWNRSQVFSLVFENFFFKKSWWIMVQEGGMSPLDEMSSHLNGMLRTAVRASPYC